MTTRLSVQKVRELTSELSAIIPRVRAVVTEPRGKHKDRSQSNDTPMVTLMEMEAKSAHNRSYIVTAREHAEQVIINREKAVSPERARQAWGLMRDLYEGIPHSRICINPDAPLGRKVTADGVITSANGSSTDANPLLSFSINSIKQAFPDAATLVIRGIRRGRSRNYVELTDANGGLMLATDVNALVYALQSILLPANDEEAKYHRRRLNQWMSLLGVDREVFAQHGLSAIHTIARLDIADTWHLNTSN
ncbi:hypothetical protein [Pseudoxanthomonas japonensis]|uniref:hypothetical protein n=1 Tax=Pseudoxanthomonas japonensis TaxID=69284 RepID=UPI003749A5DA